MFAVTFFAVLMVTLQVLALPLQSPLQPVKVLPMPAIAANVTTVPAQIPRCILCHSRGAADHW